MNTPELLLISVLKALVEIAALSLLAQGLLRLLAGKTYRENFAYRLFQVITAPVINVTRAVTPRFIAVQHLGLVAFILLFWLWLATIYAKVYVCQAQHLACFSH